MNSSHSKRTLSLIQRPLSGHLPGITPGGAGAGEAWPSECSTLRVPVSLASSGLTQCVRLYFPAPKLDRFVEYRSCIV